MIADSDTVVDPRTMVVESLYAVAADRAMPATTCPYQLTIGAELSAVNVLEHFEERDLVIFEVSGLSA